MSKIPQFDTEQEASEFWDTHDFTDFLNETEEVGVESLDIRSGHILLDLDPDSITQLEAVAHRQGINYRILAREWIIERLTAEAKAR